MSRWKCMQLPLMCALLVFALLGVTLGPILFGVIEIAHKLLVIDFELVQFAALGGIVLAPEHLARPHILTFAAAQLDQSAPVERHDLGPAFRLDRAGAVNGFGDRRQRRKAGRHGLDMQVVGVDEIAPTKHRNRGTCYSKIAQDGHGDQNPNFLRKPCGT